MKNKGMDNAKLGAFVLAGLLLLVLLLYMIGKNENLFGQTYLLKARFDNIQGLVEGNNVRYAGIQTGTVKQIRILNDTTVEVVMVLEKGMQQVIKKNAVAAIGTDGFVGNKLVNITPVRQPAAIAVEGDILAAKRSVSTDEMLQTLSGTNADIAGIVAALKKTVQRINSSDALWQLLNDREIPGHIKVALSKIRSAAVRTDEMAGAFQMLASDLKNGKGTLGMLLYDSAIALNLRQAVEKVRSAGDHTDSLVQQMNALVAGIQQDKDNGTGLVHSLFKDSMAVQSLNGSLYNIQKGTEGFNQNMEALKHNFLFRGYFKKLQRQQQQEEKQKARAAAGH